VKHITFKSKATALCGSPKQYCQFGLFEAEFVIFGLFKNLLDFFIFEKRPNEI